MNPAGILHVAVFQNQLFEWQIPVYHAMCQTKIVFCAFVIKV